MKAKQSYNITNIKNYTKLQILIIITTMMTFLFGRLGNKETEQGFWKNTIDKDDAGLWL